MTPRLPIRSQLVLAALLVLTQGASLAEGPSGTLSAVPGSRIAINGAPAAEAKLFTNQDKTILLACPPGETVYRIYRKEKNVVALRRPTVMVTGEKCRPMEGASEQPVPGHGYAESASEISFKDSGGRKIAITVPAGTLR